MAAGRGFCVKCKESVDMVGAKEITMKTGKNIMSGTCPKCGTRILRYVEVSKKRSDYCYFHRGNSDTADIQKENEWFKEKNSVFNHTDF